MYCLSQEQIDFIAFDIRQRGIQLDGLHENLLDHICIIIEEKLENSAEFEIVYSTVIKSFYRNELKEIEEETLFLLQYNRHWVLSRGLFFTILFSIFIATMLNKKLKEKENEYQEMFSNPYRAAERGFIDEVIEPSQTRQKLIRAFGMLENKVAKLPRKKHGNIPL